jgi:hypothetical protein
MLDIARNTKLTRPKAHVAPTFGSELAVKGDVVIVKLVDVTA